MEPKLTYNQKTFGNAHSWAWKKMKATITNPEGQVTLIPFDDQPNRLALVISLIPDEAGTRPLAVRKTLKGIIAKHGDCPEDQNFWAWYVTVRQCRVATTNRDFAVMFQFIQIGGFYSKTYKSMFMNYRLKLRDGVRKADVILTEEEIAYIIRKEYDLKDTEGRHKQRALDTFVLALFTAARFNDVRSIVKSVDEYGNPILMYHNKKGTRSQSIAYDQAVEGALQRGLYKTQLRGTIISAALKAALYETLPSTSNRLINYYYLHPGAGRVLKTDSRLAHITYHTARHTFCTRLLRIGISVHVVAQLAGHKNIQTTMRYYNWTREAEANNILRSVYKSESLVTRKPEWGEGASQVKPLPVEVHEALLPQPVLGELAPDDGKLIAKLKEKQQVLPPSDRRLAWFKKLKERGIII